MKKIHASTAALGVAVALTILMAACGGGDDYAAKVDGETISQADLEEEMRSIAANEEYVKQVEQRTQVRGTGAGTFDTAFTGQVLGRQIQYVLVDREVDRRKLKVTDNDLRLARDEVTQQAGGAQIFGGFPQKYQETLVERAAKVDRLTVSLSGQGASDDAAKAYYESHKDEFAEACVSHILVASKERADQVKAKLARGEDFAAVARTDSADTLSAPQGGDLGCKITAESFAVPPFIEAMMRQPIDQVGEPVQSQYGFHLIKVRSRTVPPFEETVGRAREKVVAANKAKLQEWINATVAKAKITVNPKYGTFDTKTLTVTPPAAPSTTVGTSPPGSGIQPLRP